MNIEYFKEIVDSFNVLISLLDKKGIYCFEEAYNGKRIFKCLRIKKGR